MGPRDRALVIVVGILVVLVVAFLLLSGGGGTIEGVTSPPVTVRSPSPSANATSPPETGQSFEGKDPFQPLVVSAPGGSTGGTTGGTTGGSTGGSTGNPAPTPTGSITGVNGGNSGTPSTTVTLIDIRKVSGKLVATVDVDGKDYNAGVGQTFAQNFRVLSLNTSCGTFVFGDERFSLCKGQEINK
jgi:hypothetical protein